MYIKERKIHRDRDCLLEWRVSVHKSVCVRERELKRVRIIEVEYQSDTRTTSEHEKIETKPCRKGETQKEPNRTRTTKKYVVKCN